MTIVPKTQHEGYIRLLRAIAVVEKQAKDDGLWFDAETAAEAYLQQELRHLHAVIEGEP